jgi:integrase-like protein
VLLPPIGHDEGAYEFGHADVTAARPFLRSSAQALYRLVLRVGERAGIAAPVHPHLMRHAFGDHIARFAGMRNAQFLLGHADVSTTETYVGAPTLDELRAAIRGFAYEHSFSPLRECPANPLIARRGFEPLQRSPQALKRIPGGSRIMGRLGIE